MDSREQIAFPKFSDEEIEQLRVYGNEREFGPGRFLFRTGERWFAFFVVLQGGIQILDTSGEGESEVAVHGPGEFTGDIDMITGRAAVVDGRAQGVTRVLEIESDCLKRIISEVPQLSETILSAFLMRRTLLKEKGYRGATVYGGRSNPETLKVRELLARNGVPFTWEDTDDSEESCAILQEFQVQEEDYPVVLTAAGELLRNPTPQVLARAVGMREHGQGQKYDVAIVGAGPAGLAAAVYGASEGLRTIILDALAPGGQAGTSSKIENYMGFPTGLSGEELASRALIQAQKFGADFSVPCEVERLECGNGEVILHLKGAEPVQAKVVVIASGARYRQLPLDNLAQFEGKGVYYAATYLESMMCSGTEVGVVGAGNSAGQAAVMLSNVAKRVHVIVRGDDLRKSMSSYLANRLDQIDNVVIRHGTQVAKLHGEDHLSRVTLTERGSNEETDLPISNLFVFIGADPNTAWVNDAVALDEKGFVLTGPQVRDRGNWPLNRDPAFLETSCPGVFAVGDVRSGSIKRVASAVGEGSMSVALIHAHLAALAQESA